MAAGSAPSVAVGSDRGRDRFLNALDARRQVLGETRQDGGRRLGVGQGPVGRLDLDAEAMGNVAQLVRVEVRVGLAGDRKGVEAVRGRELARLLQGLLQETQIEVDVVADQAA